MSSLRGASARNLLGPLMRVTYRVRVSGGHQVPRQGGVLLVSTHWGALDPTLLATNLTRPVAVVVAEGSTPAAWREAFGRVVIADQSPGLALREAAALIDARHAVAMFPEGEGGGFTAGAAYVQARTRVPVVPIAIFGSSGVRPTDPPRPRRMIDILVGSPFTPTPSADPSCRAEVMAVAEQMRQHFSDHLRVARLRAGQFPEGDRLDPPGHAGSRAADRHNGAL